MVEAKFPEHRDVDDIVAKSEVDLYEADFYAWTQEQARLLRDGPLDRADIANILEEIETLGRQQVAELRSRLKVLALHLLTELYQPKKASRSWASTIVNQRQEIARHIKDSPSLKAKQADIFDEAYEDARALAAFETGPSAQTFPVDSPFSLEQALDPLFWPGKSLDDRG